MLDVTCPYVKSFSYHTSGARGLKISMYIPHIEGLKATLQIFDILPRSRDI